MHAARIHEDLSLRVEEIDDLKPGPGDVLVRIHAAGVCGTDLHILDGMIKPDVYPMTLGHEAAGIVEDVGEGVSLDAGVAVAIYNKIFCGRCEQCLKGRTNICDNEPSQLGFNRDGGDAEYVIVPEQNAVPVPDGVDLATASVLTCAGMTAVHATKLSGLRLGDTAVVDGIGGVGIIVAQAAAHAGARVIAIGDSEQKLALAKAHGATDGVLVDAPESSRDGSRPDPCPHGRSRHRRVLRAGRDDADDERRDPVAGQGWSVRCRPATRTRCSRSIRSSSSCPRRTSSPPSPRRGWTCRTPSCSRRGGALTVPIAARYPLDGVHDALDALHANAGCSDGRSWI